MAIKFSFTCSNKADNETDESRQSSSSDGFTVWQHVDHHRTSASAAAAAADDDDDDVDDQGVNRPRQRRSVGQSVSHPGGDDRSGRPDTSVPPPKRRRRRLDRGDSR